MIRKKVSKDLEGSGNYKRFPLAERLQVIEDNFKVIYMIGVAFQL